MTWPEPTRKDLEIFCRVEGWRVVRDAPGRGVTHHTTYEFDLPDGRILRTRISHPVRRDSYGPSLWAHILRDQLQVSKAEFWRCVRERAAPDRGLPEPPPNALPADLVYLLINRVGLAESEVAQMSKDGAVARLQQYWAEGS